MSHSLLQFFNFIYSLQHTSGTGIAETASGHIVYGGNPLQAFLVALYEHGRFILLGS